VSIGTLGSRDLAPPGQQRLDTLLGDLVLRAPVRMPPNATIADTARAMRAADASSALVDSDPVGIVTDSDLRRLVALELPLDSPVTAVMSAPVHSLPTQAPLSSALLLMLEERCKHVGVTDGDRIIGVVADVEVIQAQVSSPLLLLGQIRRIDSLGHLDLLRTHQGRVAAAAASLVAESVEPVHIPAVVTSLNDALTGRLLRLAEAALGPPPCRYAWLELGSAGRSEQTLAGDQDSAIVYETESPAADAYFAALARRVTDALTVAGFPPCPGGHMATNLCRSLAQWQAVCRRWADSPDPGSLVEAEVFLDFRPVHGQLSMQPLESLLLTLGTRRTFLAQLARAATSFEPPLGRLGRLRPTEGFLDVKTHGTAPIVLLARLYAVAAGSWARTTPGRLAAAADAGALSRDSAAGLTDAYDLLTRLRLRAQLAAVAAGQPPGNRVAVSELWSSERRHLQDAFKAMAALQTHVRMTYRIGD